MSIKILIVVFPAIALIATLVCLYLYPFTKEKVQQMKQYLKILHEQKMNKVQSQIK